MTKKLIFFDIDGTLYDHHHQIPETTHQAIRELKAAGHILAIATGRAPYAMKQVIADTEIPNFIAFNGQYVVYNAEVIHRNPLDGETLSTLQRIARQHDHPMVFLGEKEAVANIPHHHHIEQSMGSIKLDHPRYEDDYFMDHAIFQALMFHDAEGDALYDEQHPLVKFYRWHEFSRDVVPSNGSKAEGIKKFAEKTGIQQADIIAIGDGNNDFEMIDWAGTGIAMGNAVPGLKEIADYVTTDVGDNGIMNAFQHLKLI
ncbi:Cof-type HAD-IIB family hydrolase [Macrococcus hajekii]|uniref:Cof-type HAD-IIB family hydrolase n=1 Tax=Macrococcus hajekii TaxID=198482 RepID=A0A4R6BNA6_9STAP|nr:Cof-type HAD-IIB family hydrolase [Macrococcus hajekii]TDM03330.1 Cof-type HAD-IIB family hydrolase [Macrococcus hajekii]GGA97954.1 putative phosphatase YkrA [Macrococcus hajekii]